MRGPTAPRPRIATRDASGAYPSNAFAIWLLMIGILIPASLTIYVGGAKYYSARLVVMLLFLPALVLWLRRVRSVLWADWWAFAACAWIIVATLPADRQASLSSAIAIAIEFLGGYVAARGFLFGPQAIKAFTQALKVVVITLVALALMEHLTGRIIANVIVSSISGEPLALEPEIRNGLARANAIFPHPIFLGVFCAASAAIFLYSERNTLQKHIFVGLSLFGCLLAMSSAPILSSLIVLFTYSYDRVMKSFAWRWQALVGLLAAVIFTIYVVTNNPTSWIVANLTLDPSTGYFRKATWDVALYNINLSPLIGYGFDAFQDSEEFFERASVDSVWLVLALRFGIPIVVLLILTNVASYYGARKTSDAYMDAMRTAFTLALVVFMVAGLTVHYWNTIWLIWGLYVGIRTSLKEHYLASVRQSDVGPARARSQRRHSNGPGLESA